MALKKEEGQTLVEKKRKCSEQGVLASECVKLFLVSHPDEVDAPNSASVNPVSVCIDQLIGEGGKIYGYEDVQISIWFNIISFLAYVNITFIRKFDSGKGITDLEYAFQNIFGKSMMMNKNEFIQTFFSKSSSISDVLSAGPVVNIYADTSETRVEVIRMNLSCTSVGLLYNYLTPLVLLFIEGSSPVDITDPNWEIYFVVKTRLGFKTEDIRFKILGFSTTYRFYHYPASYRLRISQILVLPTYQRQGHGCHLLESINSVAISQNYHDVTVEEPSDYLQHLRTSIDVVRLFGFKPIDAAMIPSLSLLNEVELLKIAKKFKLNPPADLVSAVSENLKINKKQLLRCWEVLIYLKLDPEKKICFDNFNACMFNRVKADVIGKEAEADRYHRKRLVEMCDLYSFTMLKYKDDSADGEKNDLEDEIVKRFELQLNQLVLERIEQIAEDAKKVMLHHSAH